MTLVNVTNIEILNNPAEFTSPIQFKITFECLQDIPEELEWKVIYVGSSKDPKHDQILDCFSMGPLEYGVMQFDLESNPPDASKIPKGELIGVTALIISVSYREKEFFRVGYFVYNNYSDEELIQNPPEQLILEKVYRNILADKPRITRIELKPEYEKEEESPETTKPNSLGLSPMRNMDGNNDENQFIFDQETQAQSGNIVNTYNPFLSYADQKQDFPEDLNFLS